MPLANMSIGQPHLLWPKLPQARDDDVLGRGRVVEDDNVHEDGSDDDMWASAAGAAGGGGALAPVAGAASSTNVGQMYTQCTNVGHPNSGSQPPPSPPSRSTGGYVVSALKRRVLPASPAG